LSAKSAKAYKKIPALIKPALACIQQIATQTADDQQRFIEIGANAQQVSVLGNIKFDLSIEPATIAAGLALKQNSFAGRFVWIIASTHQGEEELLLALYPALKAQIKNLLLVIAPRHPERFDTVKKLCEKQGLSVVMRSENRLVDDGCDVYLADSIGELKMLYAAADLAFVGGSLVAVGGHNVLEPAVVGVPVLFGPQMFNFQEIAEQMLKAGAAVQCDDDLAIAKAVLQVHEDHTFRQNLSSNAKSFVEQNQGATARVAALLAQSLGA
jgi:3-deoxy-D-manno-octulosonic-acid transferase